MLEARDYKYPPHVWAIPEIRAVQAAVDYVLEQVEAEIESMENMLLISTSDESGISRYEQIMGIKPQDTATLDERRYEAKLKYYDTYPYTEKDIKERLDRLIPDKDYTLTVGDGVITVQLALSNASMMDATIALLEEIVPLHIVLQVGVKYNRHSDIAGALSTHGAMETYTHAQLRQGDLEG